MQRLEVSGGNRLRGTVSVGGAKNSVLPILAATLINGGENVLHNCPDLRDVDSAIAILRHLGCTVEREGHTIRVDSSGALRCDVPDALMREMRSSVIFLGPILARCGEAVLSFPGGCELGPRPIDLHLDALATLGVEITEEHGRIRCSARDLRGRDILLSMPSVGATENAMLAATACSGVTRILGAAREPEILDLQSFLQKCGAQVRGAGTGEIIVVGGGVRSDVKHRILPDRIETATWLCAAAACGGEIAVTDCEPAHVGPVLARLSESGARVQIAGRTIRLQADRRMAAMGPVRTMPYPGFPTDAQAQLMAAACTARGTTIFVENIFENRYRHAAELVRMGAKICTSGRVAVVEGCEKLRAADVACTDLRGGAALVIAALAAEGTSTIREIYHIDRGYEKIEDRIAGLGGSIRRIGE